MTILNEVDIVNVQNSDFFSAMLLIGAIALICSVIIFVNSKELGFFYGLMAFGLSLICFSSALEEWTKPVGYQYTKIECTIDETMPAIEILDNYEVIEKRGKIYELKYIDTEKMEEK